MKPLIGITGMRHAISTNESAPVLLAVASGDDYAHGVETAGGLPVVVPYLESEQAVEALAERLDGLLLGGGEDPDPVLYGSEPHSGLGQVVPERDALELALIRCMLSDKKPILGICRGMQILNVAFGGTLYQDLAREWKGHTAHRQRARRNHLSHMIHVEPGSRLYDMLGTQSQLRCNSFHHQAVQRVGRGLVPVAWDDEGLIEAVEHEDYPFVVAVQWHPENLWRTSSVYLGLFQGLVQASVTRIPAS